MACVENYMVDSFNIADFFWTFLEFILNMNSYDFLKVI